MAKKMKLAKPNFIERALLPIAPRLAGKHLYFRSAFMALAAGGYDGGRVRRGKDHRRLTTATSPDGTLLPDLDDLRERSRDLVRNNPLAAGAINTKVTSIVGTGLKLRAQIDAEALGLNEDTADAWERDAEREWRLFADTPECDGGRSLMFNEIQDVVFRSRLEAGDICVLKRFIERPGSPYGLKLQLIEGDRLSNPNNARDTTELTAGIRFGVNGDPLAYNFATRHPGDYGRAGRGTKWTEIPAFGPKTGRPIVLHLHKKLRPGQSRGVPDFAPVINAFRQLGDYTESELQAAVVSSFFTVFVKTEGGEGIDDTDIAAATSSTASNSSDTDLKLAPGAVLDLANNEDISTANPGRPNDKFDPFVLSVLRQIGVALELPFEILVKHFTASYSAARAALLEAWKYYKRERRWLSQNLCRPVYEWLIAEAVAMGRLSAPGFFSDARLRAAYLGADWYGDGMPSLNPKQEADAYSVLEDRSWMTAAQITAEMTGGDWEKNQRQRVREVALRREGGTDVAAGAQAAPPPVEDDGNQDKPENELEDA